MNGTLDIWDLMVKHAEPTLSGEINLSVFRYRLVQKKSPIALSDHSGYKSQATGWLLVMPKELSPC